MFERRELQELVVRAEEMRDIVNNPHWKSAYQDLVDALDRLDAMNARSEEKEG